ncbi:mitochondrial K+-H+ exchange-related-domain-containing protein [Scleroderma yunnanense]
MVPEAMRSLRIIALPMAKPKFHLNSKSVVDRMLVYYHFNLTSPDAVENKQSWVNRLTTKAAGTWAGFGKAPKGSWKSSLYEHGERLVDRMDFEELALKGSISRGDDKTQQRPPEIPLVYPPSVYSELSTPTLHPTIHPTLSQLQRVLSIREPRHRRGFYLWMLITPLTFPFTIIPIIPNIPFFFCVWRSWSHYRAYRSSQYLSSLIDQGLVKPKPSQELDEVYRSFSPSAFTSQIDPPMITPLRESFESESKGTPHQCSSSSASTGTASSDTTSVMQELLLAREAVPRILQLFELPESVARDMYRAMEQVRVRVEKGL